MIKAVSYDEQYYLTNGYPLLSCSLIFKKPIDYFTLKNAIIFTIKSNPTTNKIAVKNQHGESEWVESPEYLLDNITSYKKIKNINEYIIEKDNYSLIHPDLSLISIPQIMSYNNILLKCSYIIDEHDCNMINFNFHHAFSDGLGFINLIKNIFKNYFLNISGMGIHQNIMDSFTGIKDTSMIIPENTICFNYDLAIIKCKARTLQVTINTYITSLIIMTLAKTIYKTRQTFMVGIPINLRKFDNGVRNNLDDISMQLDSGRINIKQADIKNMNLSEIIKYFENNLYIDNKMPTPDFMITNMGVFDSFLSQIMPNLTKIFLLRAAQKPWPGLAIFTINNSIYFQFILPNNICSLEELITIKNIFEYEILKEI